MKISLIIPFNNEYTYITDCLESILNQKLTDYEVLFACEDIEKNQELIAQWQKKGLHIVLVAVSAYCGVSVARNAALKVAQGDYIYFIDGDDYLVNEALSKMEALAKEHPGELVGGRRIGTWFRPESFEMPESGKEIEAIRYLTDKALAKYYKKEVTALHLLIPASLLKENSIAFLDDQLIYADAPFMSAIYRKVVGIWEAREAIYAKREHNDPIHLPSLSQASDKVRCKEYINSYEACRLDDVSTPEWLLKRMQSALCRTILSRGADWFAKCKKKVNAYRHQLQKVDGSILKKYSRFERLSLKMTAKGRIRVAAKIDHMLTVKRKRKGLFGSKIQRYRFIEKHFFAKMKMKDNWVFCESFFGKSYSDSTKYLYEYLYKNYGDRYRFIWCLNQKSDSIIGHPKIVKRFSLGYVYYTSRAKYRILNTRQPAWLKKREGVVFLETWHGTPLKKLVFDLDDVHAASQDHKPVFYKQTRDWDYLISANRFSTDTFERCFDINRNKILEYGYPRNDLMYAENRDEIAKEVKKELGIPEGKRVILYAPTWRDNEFYGPGKYKFSLAMDLDRMQKEFSKDSVLLLRTHYHIADKLDLSGYPGFIFNASAYEDVTKLYLISDVCITDYSSVFFDYANLRRPMLFFTYDFEDYKDVLRGLYMDMEKELPGPLLMTNDEVVDALKNLDEVSKKYQTRYDEFYEKYCNVDDGHASERVIRKVFNL